MTGKGLSYGLNLGKKKPASSKPAPAKRKPAFGVFGSDDSDDEDSTTTAKSRGGLQETAIVEIGGLETDLSTPSAARQSIPERKAKHNKAALPFKPPALKSKAGTEPISALGDLASALTSRKNAAAAEALDATVYEYDAVYDSMKPAKEKSNEDEDRRPKYMDGLLKAAEVRKRDLQIAEERKIAREREAEGDGFADKEKFVTGAYKRLQEENKRLREEEKMKEEAAARENRTGGMTAFYKELLDRDDKKHAEAVRATEEVAKAGPIPLHDEREPVEMEQSETDIAREINSKGGLVVINEDGEIVDKRQLLRGGLNVAPKKKSEPKKEVKDPRRDDYSSGRGSGRGYFGAGGKRAMVERQSRMMEEQLAATLKRSRDAEEEERQKTVEVMTKSKKTEGDISSARERYLARKKAAEEAKKTHSS